MAAVDVDPMQFASWYAIESSEAGGWRTNLVLQSDPHDCRALDAIAQIERVEVTHCSQRRIPGSILVLLDPLVHFRPLGKLEIVLPVAKERNIRHTQIDT